MNAQSAVQRRAYSTLTFKAVDEEKRLVEGIASTPSVDRMGDIVDPKGAKFTLPLPFLWQHDSHQPIGHVIAAKATAAGIKFTAQIAKGVTPKIDEAWALIKAGLVRGVSIGFRGIDVEKIKDSWGVNFKSWEWLELSAVTIPANQDASISSIKSIDRALLAATGRKEVRDRSTPPGASGLHQPIKSRTPPKEGNKVKTFQEQIAEYEAKCLESQTQMKSLIDAAGGVENLDAEQAQEYDAVANEYKKHCASLDRLKVFVEKAATAKPLAQTPNTGRPRVEVVKQPELPKGTRFARAVLAMAAGRGSVSDALEYAKRWNSQTPEVSDFIRFNSKAVAGGAVEASPGWGSELAFQNNLASEFVELLHAATVIGKINGLRRIPFNVRMAAQVGAATVDWVGESAPKPVTDLAFDEITLGFTKIAGICVFSEELARLSAPSVEGVVTRELTEQITQFMDEQFLLDSITASSSRPAAITNSITGSGASSTTAAAFLKDLNDAFAPIRAANINTAGSVIITTPDIAGGLSAMMTDLTVPNFPNLTPEGGTVMGYRVIVSNSCPSGDVIILVPSEIFIADDGGVRIDSSNQATLDMSGSTSATYSLWQRNNIGVRAERWVNYKRRRDAAVNRITSAAYAPT